MVCGITMACLRVFSSVHACGRRIRSSLSASCPLPCTPAAKSTRGGALLGSTAAGPPAAGTACCGPASQSVAPASGGGDGGGGGVITSDWPVGRGTLLWLFHMARGRSDCQSAACRASIRSCTVTTTICSQRQRVHVDMRMWRSLEARLPARGGAKSTHNQHLKESKSAGPSQSEIGVCFFASVVSLLNKPTVPENGTHHTAAELCVEAPRAAPTLPYALAPLDEGTRRPD